MAKKIKFPLEMDGGIEVRDIESLRENFSLQRVMGYFASGKLVVWLRDRYENDMADIIEKLDEDSELARKLCEIFGVPYDESYQEDTEAVIERNRKLELLKQYTEKTEYIDNVDRIAFEQDDLGNLLNKNVDVIYLFGDVFSIPLDINGKKYIGINSPKIVFDSNEVIDFEERNIFFENVRLDEKYVGILQEQEQILLEKEYEYGDFVEDVYTSDLLTEDMRIASKECYETIAREIVNVQHNIDDGTVELRSYLSREIANVQGYFEKDTNQLLRILLNTDLSSLGMNYFEE